MGTPECFVLDTDKRYRVKSWNLAVAVRIDGWVQAWEPSQFYATDDDGEEYLEDDPDGEGEWVDDIESGRVSIVMIGDDKRHEVELLDLEPISDEEYCSGCGQIGCGWC